jgi:hypothetical protein
MQKRALIEWFPKVSTDSLGVPLLDKPAVAPKKLFLTGVFQLKGTEFLRIPMNKRHRAIWR